MKPGIKIIKRRDGDELGPLETSDSERSIEQETRDMVSTVKTWITELQERKRSQLRTFPPLPIA